MYICIIIYLSSVSRLEGVLIELFPSHFFFGVLFLEVRLHTLKWARLFESNHAANRSLRNLHLWKDLVLWFLNGHNRKEKTLGTIGGSTSWSSQFQGVSIQYLRIQQNIWSRFNSLYTQILGMESNQQHVRNVLKPRTMVWPSKKVDLRPQAGPENAPTWHTRHGDLWFPDVFAIILPKIWYFVIQFGIGWIVRFLSVWISSSTSDSGSVSLLRAEKKRRLRFTLALWRSVVHQCKSHTTWVAWLSAEVHQKVAAGLAALQCIQ